MLASLLCRPKLHLFLLLVAGGALTGCTSLPRSKFCRGYECSESTLHLYTKGNVAVLMKVPA